MRPRKTYYARRKRRGLCVDCPNKRGTDGTTARCRPCADELNADCKYRRTFPREAPPLPPEDQRRVRLEAGVCIDCGSPDTGLFRCASCDRKRSEARAALAA